MPRWGLVGGMTVQSPSERATESGDGSDGSALLDVDDGRLTHRVPAGVERARLDQVLTRAFPDLSRARLQALIKSGAVSVNGAVVQLPKSKPGPGDEIVVLLPEPETAIPEPEDIPLTVLFEDAHLIVIDKPAGLIVHPGAGHDTGTLVNALLHHCGDSLSGIGGVRRPGIVHRLDRETSGVMVVAKTDRAHRHLSKQFASHGADGRLRRRYRALVWGVFDRPTGSIDAAIGRSDSNRTRMAVVADGRGRHALTHYAVDRTFFRDQPHAISELMVELATGRTHQIRVHLASQRHPVVGDPTYGSGFLTKQDLLPPDVIDAVQALRRQALHAELIGFEHPETGEAMAYQSDVPEDIGRVVSELEAASR